MSRVGPLLLALLFCGRAMAADELPEVLVTARGIAEDAGTVPLAIAVISAQELGPGGIEGMDELATRTPGLAFESLWGGSLAAPVLRGLSQPSTAGDNVGVFVDDIYQAGRSALDIEMLDFERVEIIRGPQNTLFGRSTFAGAIRYVTARPTSTPLRQLQFEAGSQALVGARGVVSQRIGNSSWLGRLAASYRQGEGTWNSQAGESLAGFQRAGLSLVIAREQQSANDDVIDLNIRLNASEHAHPASITLDADDHNCGARGPGPGYWSYFCGPAPTIVQPALTTGLPDSEVRSAQAALRFEHSLGGMRLRSLSGYYISDASTYRDFDGTDQGLWSGVCTDRVNCSLGGAATSVTRFAWPNVVSRPDRRTTDWSQEFRVSRDDSAGIRWTLGLAGAWTKADESASFGADRGDLLPTERLTSIVAANPNQVGQQSPLNRALVADSRREQALQSRSIQKRRNLAAFGAIDAPLATGSRIRLELRAETETEHIDSLQQGFLPDTAPDPASIRYSDVTPRLSVDMARGPRWYGYASLARGVRSGGTNTLPNLDAEERSFDPEYNWTAELGLHYTDAGTGSAQLTVYRIDWRNTQILGVATTPGVNSLITRNTAGILALGVEASLELRLGSALTASLAFSHADATFREGSDDAGSRVFCGLTAQPPASDFCTFGPPRSGAPGNIPLVPYLDGNRTARAPRGSWSASLQLRPQPVAAGWQLNASASLGCQDNVFERPVNGASYGARCLLDARAALARGRWRVELWGANLTDDRYLRTASSRGANFYPSLPRPIDLLYAEGRRAGLTVSVNLSAL